jgi:flagellar protein FlaF
MMQTAYDQVLEDSPREARARERAAISRSIEYMEAAERAGLQSREAIVALNFLRQLWTILIEDLASQGNELPAMLRAQVISIGLWIMRHAEDIRMERQTSFRPAIDISKLMVEGLA